MNQQIYQQNFLNYYLEFENFDAFSEISRSLAIAGDKTRLVDDKAEEISHARSIDPMVCLTISARSYNDSVAINLGKLF